MSKIKIFLILANLFLGFAIYITFKNDNEKEIGTNKLLISTLSKLDSLKLDSGNSSKIIGLTKVSQNWQIVEPYSWEANKLALSNFQTKIAHFQFKKLNNLRELKEKGEILEDYGIDEYSPRIRISSNQDFIDFKIGNITRDGSNCYILANFSKLNEKIICKVDKEIINFCQSKPKDWTDGSIIKTPLYAIDKIAIKFGDETTRSSHVILEKNEEDWVFIEPFKGDSDNEKVLLQLNSLISTNILKFQSEDEKTYLNAKKWKTKLEISGFNQTETILFNINEDGTILGKRNSNDTLFILNADFLSLLNDWSTKLRNRTLFKFSTSNIQSFEVIKEDEIIKISKNKDDSWDIAESNSSNLKIIKADSERVKSFFRELNTVSISQFLSTSINEKSKEEFKIDEPIYRINSLNKNSISNSYYLSRMKETEKMWSVIDQNQSLICLVQNDLNKILDIDSLTFRNKNLIPEDFISKIIIIERKDSNNSITIDSSKSNEENNTLLNFKAETFINCAFLDDGTWIEGDWIPWEYKLSFLNSEKNNTKQINFYLSERKGASTWYGGDPVNGLIFKLPLNLIDEIYTVTAGTDGINKQ